MGAMLREPRLMAHISCNLGLLFLHPCSSAPKVLDGFCSKDRNLSYSFCKWKISDKPREVKRIAQGHSKLWQDQEIKLRILKPLCFYYFVLWEMNKVLGLWLIRNLLHIFIKLFWVIITSNINSSYFVMYNVPVSLLSSISFHLKTTHWDWYYVHYVIS